MLEATNDNPRSNTDICCKSLDCCQTKLSGLQEKCDILSEELRNPVRIDQLLVPSLFHLFECHLDPWFR